MPPATCPDNETLKSLLLGKLAGSQLAELEEHLLNCESCASTAETLDGADALTEAIARSETPSGDEDVLGPAIEQAKRLGSLLDTVRIDETDAGYFSASSSATARTEKSRYNLDFLSPAQQPDELGRLGDYRVLQVLGVGGMGIVFLGEDIRLGRPVALKVMRPGVAAKHDAKARFLREARATAALSHDHIVQIFQVGEHNDVPYIAMQYLAGESLETRLKRVGKLPDAEVIRIGKQVASGLAAAHEAGMIHRDIKPDNIWMEQKTERAKILDFGLVRDDHSDQELTQSGTILGTPRYMAPEQVGGEKVDHRSDLFSLGSLLYHLAAGQPPFSGSTIPSLLYAIAHYPPQPLAGSSLQINQALADLIMRLLSKQPADRPASAAHVAEELARIESDLTAPKTAGQQNHQPPHNRWPLVASAGAAALAIMLAVIVITIRSRDGTQTKIKIAEGTTTNLNLAPGSEVAIEQKSPQATTNPTLQSDPASEQTDTSQTTQPVLNQLSHVKVTIVGEGENSVMGVPLPVGKAFESQRPRLPVPRSAPAVDQLNVTRLYYCREDTVSIGETLARPRSVDLWIPVPDGPCAQVQTVQSQDGIQYLLPTRDLPDGVYCLHDGSFSNGKTVAPLFSAPFIIRGYGNPEVDNLEVKSQAKGVVLSVKMKNTGGGLFDDGFIVMTLQKKSTKGSQFKGRDHISFDPIPAGGEAKINIPWDMTELEPGKYYFYGHVNYKYLWDANELCNIESDVFDWPSAPLSPQDDEQK